MEGRQRGKLDATAGKERVGVDPEGFDPHLHQARERRVNVATGFGCKNFDLPANGRRRCLRVLDQELGGGVGRIDKRSKADSSRNELM